MAGKRKAKSKLKTKFTVVLVVLLVIVIAVIALLWYFKPQFFHKILGSGEHYWSDWETSVEATCTENGEEKRVCTVCGEEETREISATGHSYGDWLTVDSPTCEERGSAKRVCSSCGNEEIKRLNSTGHRYDEWIIDTEPTCGENGLKHYICLDCGKRVEEVIPATGNHTDENDDGICDDCGQETSIIGNEDDISTADFSIHFLELGNKYAGDSLLIKCGDTEVLIDAGSRQASATTIKAYVDQYCEDGVLEYVIATHADQDHISGFVGNAGNPRTGILYQYEIGTFIMFDNVKPDKEDGTLYNSFLTAVDYAEEHGAKVYTASQCYDMTDGAQRQYYLDENQTLSINILYNYYYYNVDRNDENNHSVVTLLTQELSGGNKYYLFTGDLEEDGESKMVDYYSVASNSKSEYDILPEVELYKAGHHGSKTSSTEKLLNVIKPKYVAVCCCAGSPEYTKTDANTFPTQQMIDNVSKYTDQIYVTTLATDLPELNDGTFASQSGYNYTSMNGNIVFYFKNGLLKLYCSNNYTLLKDTDWFKEHRTWNAN